MIKKAKTLKQQIQKHTRKWKHSQSFGQQNLILEKRLLSQKFFYIFNRFSSVPILIPISSFTYQKNYPNIHMKAPKTPDNQNWSEQEEQCLRIMPPVTEEIL